MPLPPQIDPPQNNPANPNGGGVGAGAAHTNTASEIKPLDGTLTGADKVSAQAIVVSYELLQDGAKKIVASTGTAGKSIFITDRPITDFNLARYELIVAQINELAGLGASYETRFGTVQNRHTFTEDIAFDPLSEINKATNGVKTVLGLLAYFRADVSLSEATVTIQNDAFFAQLGSVYLTNNIKVYLESSLRPSANSKLLKCISNLAGAAAKAQILATNIAGEIAALPVPPANPGNAEVSTKTASLTSLASAVDQYIKDISTLLASLQATATDKSPALIEILSKTERLYELEAAGCQILTTKIVEQRGDTKVIRYLWSLLTGPSISFGAGVVVTFNLSDKGEIIKSGTHYLYRGNYREPWFSKHLELPST